MNEAVEKGMGLLHQRLLRPELPRLTDKLFLASFAVATNPEVSACMSCGRKMQDLIGLEW